jgi:methionyl-tRNA synthetase
MLMSAGLSLPREEFAHGFFTIDGVKMSKSLGNMISPLEISREFGNDALRLGLLSSFEFGNDGDFSSENLAKFYDKKMASGLGNLFNRVIVLVTKFLDGQKPGGISTEKTAKEYEIFAGFIEEKKLKSAIDYFFQIVDSANELLNEKEPWKLVKTDKDAAKKVFAKLLQKLETLKLMAKIIMPETYPRMVEMLGDKNKVRESQILFARIDKK